MGDTTLFPLAVVPESLQYGHGGLQHVHRRAAGVTPASQDAAEATTIPVSGIETIYRRVIGHRPGCIAAGFAG
jgi:hypothetical protein